MKKYVYLLAMALFANQFLSCSSDDDSSSLSELEKNYFTIEKSIYNDGTFPSGTVDEIVNGVEMSSQVMNGAMNFITIFTEQKIDKFFVGVKGVPGYLEYVPTNASTRDGESGALNLYTIPVMMSQSYTGNATLLLSGQLQGGDISKPVEKQMFYIETIPGEVEVKLSFSNSKDVDLHLYTPGGEHIYYGHRGGTVTNEKGEEVTYGLDVDSNAGCSIDGINKENIYLPAEKVESGTYKVVVNMFDNCDRKTPTSWSVVVRYQGEFIRPSSGSNPAYGVYPVGAGDDDMTQAMTFTINNSARTRGAARFLPESFKPIPLTDMDKMKLEEAESRK
jgi:hypothetical protein